MGERPGPPEERPGKRNRPENSEATMEPFTHRNGELYAEEVPVGELAGRYGTPLFVYSRRALRAQMETVASAMQEVRPDIYFAVKANTNAAVIHTLARAGAGADVVSAGELFRARRAGVEPGKMVFAGVGKSREEIDYALREGIHFFSVESEPELERIARCAQAAGRNGRIAIRVNPDVDPKTHKYTSTGKKENKFGVDLERAAQAYERAAKLTGLEIAGLHMHLGSPIASYAPYEAALEKVAPLCRALKKRFASFRYLDIGGGMGIPYRPDDPPFDWQAFATHTVPLFKELDLEVGLEPGRYLTGNAGLLVTRVEYVKPNPLKHFVVVDAAMNDLIRPALYQAFHHVIPVRQTEESVFGDLVGPICETGDFLAVERNLPRCREDDLLAVRGAGAYAFVMASNYNSRPRAAEVMVHGAEHALVRARESRDDLVRGESIPSWE